MDDVAKLGIDVQVEEQEDINDDEREEEREGEEEDAVKTNHYRDIYDGTNILSQE